MDRKEASTKITQFATLLPTQLVRNTFFASRRALQEYSAASRDLDPYTRTGQEALGTFA
jgi:hypothetical protein